MAILRRYLGMLSVTFFISSSWLGGTLASEAVNVTLGGLVVAVSQDASCCGLCNEEAMHRYIRSGVSRCRCDDHCVVYQDCCLDFELYCTDLQRRLVQRGNGGLLEAFSNCSGSLGTRPAPLGIGGRESEHDQHAACPVSGARDFLKSVTAEYACKLKALWGPIILARDPTTSLVRVNAGNRMGYVLVQSCRNNTTTQEMASLCTDDLGSFRTLGGVKRAVPVTAPDGLHYRNAYCAQCSGFKEEDLQYWQVKLNCPENVAIIGLTDSSIGNCEVGPVTAPSPLMPSAPLPRLVPTDHHCVCHPGARFGAACGVYQLNQRQCCKNPHCEEQCQCLDNPFSFRPNTEIVDALPISALFDFNSHRELRFSLDGRPSVLVCDPGTFFDAARGSCRRFLCPFGQQLGAQGECVAAETEPCLLSRSREPPAFSLDLQFHTQERSLDFLESYLISTLMNISLNLTIIQHRPVDCSHLPQLSHCMFFVVIESPHTFVETLSRFFAAAKVLVVSTNYVKMQKLTLRNFPEPEFLINSCGRLGQTPAGYSWGSEFEINGTSFVNIRVANGSVTCPSERTFREVIYNPTEGAQEFVYLCMAKLNCSLVVLNSSEFKWLDNTAVELQCGGNLSSQDIVKLSDEEIVVCLQPEWSSCRKSSPVPGAIFSVVCLIVSQIFLLVSLLSFCIFPELCTLPGKNLFCFIAALFLTQLLFLLGPGSPLRQFTIANEELCLAFAVVIHYLLLAVFFWSNVVSLHLARTFGFKLQMQNRRFNRAFFWYSLYGWGAPALVSAAGCVLHHLLVVDGERVAMYGIESSHCIPSDVGMLYLVAVPITILMSSNAVLFVQTVIGIRRTRKSTKMVVKDQRRLDRLQSEVILCSKIFVATGMTWFLVALLGFFKVDGFSYFFTVLISSQGPLLFLSFTFTERIRKLWLAKLCDRVKCPDEYTTKETPVSSVSGTVGASHARHARNDHSHDSARIEGKAMLLEDKTAHNIYKPVSSDSDACAYENQL